MSRTHKTESITQQAVADAERLALCHTASLQLLQRNLTPGGILAATRNEASEEVANIQARLHCAFILSGWI